MKKSITRRDEDYAQWYLDVIAAADLAEHGPVKGTMIIKPYGYAIWERMQQILNRAIKASGAKNAYFPLFIPESFLKREEHHVEGFSPECAVVTHAGGKELEEPLVVRPTSETIMYDAFSRWISSYRDLPLRINQWANVVRWELRPRLFLRTTEFLWQEGHTAHAAEHEADTEARKMLEVYRTFVEGTLALSVVPGVKTEGQKFAGAVRTYCIEAMMQDGKALQMGTSHFLGQNFAKVFDVSFLDSDSQRKFAWQTSWGVSTRMIGGLIMSHSDDAGLVLPPAIAPIAVVAIPITRGSDGDSAVFEAASSIARDLTTPDTAVELDSRDMKPGAKYYEWEKKGVPVRIEIGSRDLEKQAVIVARRDTGVKEVVPLAQLATRIPELLADIQQNLYLRAQQRLASNTLTVDTWEEFVAALGRGSFILAHWDGTPETEQRITDETKATIRCMPFNQSEEPGTCVRSGRPSTRRVLFGKAY